MAINQYSDDYRISAEPWYKRNVLNWALYDLANTIFSMVVVSLTISPLIYNLYYLNGENAQRAINLGNFALSYTLLIGNILMAVSSPFLGAYSDNLRGRKGFLMKITMLCIVTMASLSISIYTHNVLVILVIFLFSNLFYQMGLVVYDAMLPFITDKEYIGKIGGIGIALGYFGSFIGIGLGFLLEPFFGDFYAQTAKTEVVNGITKVTPEKFQLGYIPYIYPVAALMFLLFALPLITVKEKPNKEHQEDLKFGTLIKTTFNQVKNTGKDIFSYHDMKYLLLGWLIFVDIANTVILFMTPIVSVGLEFGQGSTVLFVLAIGIGSAVLLTYPVGIFVDKYGPKKGLILITTLWMISLLVAVFTNLNIGASKTPAFLVYVFPVIVGPALGGTWVVQRQYVTELAPKEQVGNYFGFTNIFGRISAAIGPFVWSISIVLYESLFHFGPAFSTRLSVLNIGAIMLIGALIIILNVSDVHKVFLKGGRATGKETWIDGQGNVLLDTSRKNNN